MASVQTFGPAKPYDVEGVVGPKEILQVQGAQAENQMNQLKLLDQVNAMGGRNALKALYADPQNIDTQTGYPNANALSGLAKQYPAVAQQLMKDSSLAREHSAIESFRLAQADRQKVLDEETVRKAKLAVLPHVMDARAGQLEAYQSSLAASGDPEVAKQAAVTAGVQKIDSLSKLGVLGNNQESILEDMRNFDPIQAKSQLTSFKDYQRKLALENKASVMQPTDFMREAASVYGEGTPEYAAAVKRNVERRNAPTNTEIKISGIGAPGTGKVGAPTESMLGDVSLTGPDYMKSLPPEYSGLIKGLVEGKVPLTSFSTRPGPGRLSREQAMAMAFRADPDFSSTRAKVVQDFASGTPAKNITSINTALQHMDAMTDLAEAMKTPTNVPLVNAAINKVRVATGDSSVTNFETARLAVSEEMKRVFTEVGAGSLAEQQAWYERFMASSSPEQLSGSIKTAAKLLEGRIEALNSRWKRGGFKTDYPGMIDESNVPVIKRLGIKSALVERASGGGSAYVETRKTADGRTLGKKADGTIEEVK